VYVHIILSPRSPASLGNASMKLARIVRQSDAAHPLCVTENSNPNVVMVKPLGRRPYTPNHILGHAGLPYFDTELEQLSMDPWNSPRANWRVLISRISFRISSGTAGRPTTASRPSALIQPKTRAMPANNGVRLHDRQRLANLWKQPIETNEYQMVETLNESLLGAGSAARTLICCRNVPKSLPRALPATEIDRQPFPTNQPEKIPHHTTASPDFSVNRQPDEVSDRDGLLRRYYRPINFGFRFSAKAVIPSLISSEKFRR